jgi:hypothetical protein
MSDALTAQITTFVENVVQAMGVALTVTGRQTPDGAEVALEGETAACSPGAAARACRPCSTWWPRRSGANWATTGASQIDCNGFRR